MKSKPKMVAGAQWDTPEVVARYLNILTYSDKTNFKYTLSCTRPSKIVVNGVGVPYLGAARHHTWLKA